MKKALVLLFDKFEEIEAIAPIDIMRRAGVDVLTASLESGLRVVGRSGITVEADAFFKDVCRRNFDIVVLPGGPGVHNLKGCEPVLEVLKKQAESGGLLAAICAAPVVLDTAGVLAGTMCTAHACVAESLGNCDQSKRVVFDKNVITSRGAGTAVEFALKIVEILSGEKTSKDVAKSIHFID